jgi:hypothetical protein
MVNGRPGPAPRLLPAGVTEDQLRDAVAHSRSWNGVLRALDLRSSSFGRKLRNACNELDIDYSHFRSILATDARLREVITTSTDWPTALAKLGYAKGSGTARATVPSTAIASALMLPTSVPHRHAIRWLPISTDCVPGSSICVSPRPTWSLPR